jgi:hypothetical protein
MSRRRRKRRFALSVWPALLLVSAAMVAASARADGGERGETLVLTEPLENDIFRAGDTIEISGTVEGPGFENYSADWGFGQSPTEWFTTGIELMNGGTEPVVDGTLAFWDTAAITEPTYATLRVIAVFADAQLEERRTLYFDPTFKEGWPAKLYGDPDVIAFVEPTAADLNNDGYQEVIVYLAGVVPLLYVVDHSGAVLPGFPVEVEPTSDIDVRLPYPSVADLNNDGLDEIVVFRPKNRSGNCSDPPCVLVYDCAGQLLSTFPVSYPDHPDFTGSCREFSWGRQRLSLADLDRDGSLEIVIISEMAVTVLDNQGNTLDGWPKALPGWVAGPHEGYASFGNLDDDADLEIVIADDWSDPPNQPGEDKGRVYAFNVDGTDVPGWPLDTRDYSFASPSIGDIDDDGQEEIVVAFRDVYSQPCDWGVVVYEADATIAAGWPQLAGEKIFSNPALADFDSDGQLEIVVSLDNSRTYVFRSDGTIVDGWPQSMCWTDWYSPIVGDITGDGVPDVIANTEDRPACSVYARDFQGGLIGGFPKITGASVLSPPALADIDNDGYVELIATSNQRQSGPGDALVRADVYVWELDAPYDPSTMHWPMFQHDLRRSGRYAPPRCPGDLDGDGDVDLTDLARLLSNYGMTGGATYEDGDLDSDGDVDLSDLAALLSVYGTSRALDGGGP